MSEELIRGNVNERIWWREKGKSLEKARERMKKGGLKS